MEPTTSYVPVDLNPAATQDRRQQEGFEDDRFSQPYAAAEPLANSLADIANSNPDLVPAMDEVPPPVLPGQEDPVPDTPPAPQRLEPEVFEYEDGSTLTIEKTNRGWRASLDSGVQVENFYGRTKEEMFTNIAAAKIHATRHIRDLNRKIKLTARNEIIEPQQPVQPALQIPQPRALTPEDINMVKQQLSENPDLALDTLFQKKTGMTVGELALLAREGRIARAELEMEGVSREFTSNHPEYLLLDDNYSAMVGWLAKYKLNRTLTKRNQEEIMGQLYEHGFWTLDNLEEAFEELTDSGLLELAPDSEVEEEEDELPPAPPRVPLQPAAQPTPSPRIARVRVGPRAGLGIRTRETTVSRQDTSQRPPSAEELDNLSDDDIQKLFSGVRRVASQSARR